jgi:hypothetical protein
MQVVAELDRRIEEARRLLVLDELHLQRVSQAGLNTMTARDLVERQRRYLDRLIVQHDRVVAHRLALHARDRTDPAAGT